MKHCAVKVYTFSIAVRNTSFYHFVKICIFVDCLYYPTFRLSDTDSPHFRSDNPGSTVYKKYDTESFCAGRSIGLFNLADPCNRGANINRSNVLSKEHPMPVEKWIQGTVSFTVEVGFFQGSLSRQGMLELPTPII